MDRDRERAGEPGVESFDDFYRRSLPAMVRLAHLLTAGSPVAEELVQEAFIGVHRHWDSVEHPTAYLRQAVVHQAASHHRRVAREQRAAGVPDDRRAAPGEPVVDELRVAVAALGQRQRTAVVLRYYADLSDAEIAASMGCRVAAVKSLLHRALKELREVAQP